ncbi:uncharacterized protein PRCAT00006267001 [Priceomyces carsonii]|uniref:uncharacterized protein n=1 Tax=Priceomyces carsonii TaxID=28549 RepID=UPI002ED93493|nr:unnamed protein product [Priceomyces carsonii]
MCHDKTPKEKEHINSNLKFVFPKKRNRRACDMCRKRKHCCERIDGLNCKLCLKLNKNCTYKGKTNDRILYNKHTAGNLLEESTTKKNGYDIEQSLSKCSSLRKRTSQGSPSHYGATFEEHTPDHHSCSHDSKVPKITKENLSLALKDVSVELMTTSLMNGNTFATNEAFSHVHTEDEVVSSDSFKSFDSIEESKNYITDITRSYGERLLRLYFVYINPFLPVISRKQFHFMMKNDAQEILNHFSPTLLAAILIRSLEYWDRDNELVLHSRPSASKLCLACFNLITYDFSRVSGDENDKICLLQSCLLHMPYIISTIHSLEDLSRINAASKLLSISTFLINSLNLSVTSFKSDLNMGFRKQSDCIVRNNLWWSYYIEEKWFSLLTIKPSAINEGNFEFVEEFLLWPNLSYLVTKTLDANEAESQQKLTKCEEMIEDINYICWSYFYEVLKITIICSEINQFWYSIADFNEAKRFEDLEKIYWKTNDIKDKVENWWRNIPAVFKSSTEKHTSFVNANANLRLFHAIARICIFKILVKKFTLYSSFLESNDFGDLAINMSDDFRKLFLQIKLEILNFYVDYVEAIKKMKVNDLSGFWYPFANYQFSFILIFLSLLIITFQNDRLANDSPENIVLFERLNGAILDYKSVLENRSEKWKIMRLPIVLLKNLLNLELKNGDKFIEYYRYSGIISGHAVGHLFYPHIERRIIDDHENKNLNSTLKRAAHLSLDNENILHDISHTANNLLNDLLCT